MIDQPGITVEEKESSERWNVVIYEFLGTALLVYGSVTCQNNVYAIALCYYGVLVLFARLCGGHFNPAVSLSMMLQGNINFSQFMTYIVPQFAGAFLGGVLAFGMLDMNDAPYMQLKPLREIAGSILGELIGSIIFLLFIQIQYIKETQITHDAIVCFVFVTAVFFAGREFVATTSKSLLNPAAATSLSIFNCLYAGNWKQIANLWIFVAGPFAAAIISAILYTKVYLSSIVKRY